MQGPDNRLSRFLQIFEQEFCLKDKTVNIVQMNHIRIPPANLADETPGLSLRGKPVLSFEKRREHMQRHIRHRSETVCMNAFRRFPAAVGYERHVPVFFQRMTDIHQNPAHTSAAAYGADL